MEKLGMMPGGENHALHHVQVLSRQQWQRDGYRYDLTKYLDAATAAIVACVERYQPQRGVQFHTYAQQRINGAIRDASQGYQSWRDYIISPLPTY